MAELVLPHAVLAALWLPVLSDSRGDGVAGAALSAVTGGQPHLVQYPDGSTRELRRVAPELVGRTLTDVGAVLPAPGHVTGVPGVALVDAVDAGQCLLVATPEGSWAAVPVEEQFGSELEPGTLVRWALHPFPFAERPVSTLLGQAGSLAEARRELTTALVQAADALAELDLASWRPDAAREAAAVLHEDVSSDVLPPGLSAPRVDILTRAARLLALVQLALVDDGGAVVAQQGAERRRLLGDLEHTARRALAAASVSTRR
ncbi:MAG TPA: hypothetical protein VK046_04935 [Actinomycetaceae bacterium]|nr:hypothetical protein [Actinomycetaceae bacterium]